MDITPQLSESAKRITAYGPQMISINAEPYDAPLIVFPERVETWKTPALDEAALMALADTVGQCEILLIGCGQAGEFIAPSLRRALRDKTGAGIEVMDTGAACRTFNVLLAEGREVVAALLMP